MNKPKQKGAVDVSVVTPTYNRVGLLSRVWNSLKDQPLSLEWVIVDDASTDNTEEVVQSFADDRITYIRHSANKGGPNAGRNEGARVSRGRYVVLLDDDDEQYPESLPEMVRLMDEATPDVGAIVFRCVLPGEGRWDDPVADGAVYGEKDVICRNILGPEKIYLYRREVFDLFSLPEDILRSDGVFVMEISKKFKFQMFARPGRIYHFDASSSSLADAMISASRHIALGYERVIRNHSAVLRECPEAEAAFALKALFRYALAHDRKDAFRMFRRVAACGRSADIMRGFVLLVLGGCGMVKVAEKLRVARIMRERFGI